MVRKKTWGALNYQRALNITDNFPEAPETRENCIDLLQQAGYIRGINKKPYNQIPDNQLFAVARDVKIRAGDYLKEYFKNELVEESEKDNVAFLYAIFNYDPNDEFAPEVSELEKRLLE
jgi:hypothetical protein